MGNMGTNLTAPETALTSIAPFHRHQMIPHHQMGVMMRVMAQDQQAAPELRQLQQAMLAGAER